MISGELDIPSIISDSRAVAERLPRARSATLIGTAHLPFVECPARVADAIRDALSAPARPPDTID